LLAIPTKLTIPIEKLINAIFVNNTNMDEEKDEKIVLKENIKKFMNSGEIVYKTQDYTSATILYFKALFSVLDLVILKDTGKVPKDHSERFRILELRFPELYKILDKLYPTYRDTYTASIDKNICNVIKENVERIIKEQGIL
jgi:uncharacterized protein (UPF0332 family)